MITMRACLFLVVFACAVVALEENIGPAPDFRQHPSDVWVMTLRPHSNPRAVARKLGLRYLHAMPGLPNVHAFRADGNGAAHSISKGAEENADVIDHERQMKKQQYTRNGAYRVNDPRFPAQWHLHGTPGVDVGAVDAWTSEATGLGVVIAVVDDGLQHTHPDISPGYRADLSHDWNRNSPDPSPGREDNHGTSAAGVAAAHRNAVCGVGSAPEASLAGLRLIGGPSSDYMEAMALSHMPNEISIYTNSWGPYDDGRDLVEPGRLTRAAIDHTASTGRHGKGSIYVWAGGNGAQSKDNGNYDGYANRRTTIAVGALGYSGRRAYYSEKCACLMLTAPSSGIKGHSITTTDRTGTAGYSRTACTNTFGGTSSAAPLVAGGIASLLSKYPALSRRDVLHILARSATKVDTSARDWVTVNAEHGIHHSHEYGWGLMNMPGALELAATWTAVPPQKVCTTNRVSVSTSISDNGSEHIWNMETPTRECIGTDGEHINYVEYVTVTVEASHSSRGDLIFKLRSPNGVESILSEVHDDFNYNYPSGGWTFGSARHWGSSMKGIWQLKVRDGRRNGRVGRMLAYSVDIYGHIHVPPEVATRGYKKSEK